MRSKEEANDYRYFADPDLTPFMVTNEMLQSIKATVPELPEEKAQRYTNSFGLPAYDAQQLAEEKETAAYFENLVQVLTNGDAKQTSRIKQAANWILGPVRSELNESGTSITAFKVPASSIAALILLIEEGKLNFSTASGRVFKAVIEEPSTAPLAIAEKLNLIQNSDSSAVEEWVDAVLAKMPDKVQEYKKGKKGLIGLFVGEVKKISAGKADPKLTNDLLLKKLQ